MAIGYLCYFYTPFVVEITVSPDFSCRQTEFSHSKPQSMNRCFCNLQKYNLLFPPSSAILELGKGVVLWEL